MTRAPQAPAASARSVRTIHTALISGVLMFGIVVQFVLKRSWVRPAWMSPLIVNVLLGVSLAAGAAALAFRSGVPRRSTSESADQFWAKAATPALRVWALVEAMCLLAVILYLQSGSPAAIGIAVVGLLLFVALNPGALEKS